MTLSILIALLALGLAALAVLVALWLVFFPHAPEDLGGAENLDARAEPVRIPLPDGDALSGWWLPGSGRGTLLLLHGFGRNHARMWRYGGFLRNAGYGLLAIDFRSSRSRRRLPTTLGHHEIGEAQAALDWLRSRSGGRGDPVAVMGESLGGSVALLLAARNPEIVAVVVDGAFADGRRVLEDACERWARLPGPATAALLRWLGRRFTGHDPGSLDVAAEVRGLASRPVLLIHGVADDRLSPAHAAILWQAAGEKDPLWIIHGAGHNEGWRFEPRLYSEVVLAFLEPPLRGAGAGLAGGVRASAVVRRPRSTGAPGVAPVQAIGKLAGLRGRRARRPPAA